jgi:hypothetical protein
MNTVLKFDRVVLTKELNEKFKQVGETFEIANILEDSFLLRSAKTKVAIGVISFSDFDKHFVREESFKGWTKWTPLVGFDGQSDAYYRTNRKKVQVKFLTDKVRAECCCCRDDDFNLSFGVQLAYLRCLNKARAEQRTRLNAELAFVEKEIAENQTIIKKMVNSTDN